MRVVEVNQSNQLVVTTCPVPALLPGHALVKVTAFGINRADLLQRDGKYPPPKGASDILGLEIAGTVEQVDEQYPAWQGVRVCTMLSGGGYSEYVNVPIEHLITVPGTLTDIEAAAIPEVFLTATQTLDVIAGCREGQKALIHAGASGLGSALIQLAKLKGMRVATTCSSQDKLDYCLGLGADLAINYKAQSFVEVLRGKGFKADLVVDVVAGDYIAANLNVLATDGQIVVLAIMGGRYAEKLDLAKMLAKRASLTASTLRNRDVGYKSRLVAKFVQEYLPSLSKKQLKANVFATYGVDSIESAHQCMRDNKNQGKLVVTW